MVVWPGGRRAVPTIHVQLSTGLWGKMGLPRACWSGQACCGLNLCCIWRYAVVKSVTWTKGPTAGQSLKQQFLNGWRALLGGCLKPPEDCQSLVRIRACPC